MQERDGNFLTKHQKLFFTLAVIVVLLNIGIYLLVPQQRNVQYTGTVTEYSLTDSTFAAEHDVLIDGYFMQSVLLADTFEGTFAVSGLEGTEESDGAFLQRDGQLWRVYARDGAGQPLTTGIAAVRYDKENDIWLMQRTDPDHFLVIGVSARNAACWRYAEAFGLSYKPEA